MSFEQLGSVWDRNEAEWLMELRRREDPTECPLCGTRLNFFGRSRDCPYGHWRRDW